METKREARRGKVRGHDRGSGDRKWGREEQRGNRKAQKKGKEETEGCLTKLSLNSSALAMASSIASSATRRATVSVSAILCPNITHIKHT